MKRALVAALLTSAGAFPAWAGVPHSLLGHDFAESKAVDGKTLALNGLGLRTATVFAVKVYVAAFYVGAPVTTGEAARAAPGPKRIEFFYLRDFDKDQCGKAWKYQFDESVKTHYDGLERDLTALVVAQGAIHKNETLAFEIDDQETRFYQDDVLSLTIHGKDFGAAILEMMFGANPPTEDVKAGLLGKNEK